MGKTWEKWTHNLLGRFSDPYSARRLRRRLFIRCNRVPDFRPKTPENPEKSAEQLIMRRSADF